MLKRYITAEDFPDLLPFVGMYATKGQTMVKPEDGSWEAIDVAEGFSQGRPLSPVFAGKVLNRILRRLVDTRVLERRQKKTKNH